MKLSGDGKGHNPDGSGYVATCVGGGVWILIGIFVLSTGGNLILGVGAIVLGLSTGLYGLLVLRRQHRNTLSR